MATTDEIKVGGTGAIGSNLFQFADGVGPADPNNPTGSGAQQITSVPNGGERTEAQKAMPVDLPIGLSYKPVTNTSGGISTEVYGPGGTPRVDTKPGRTQSEQNTGIGMVGDTGSGSGYRTSWSGAIGKQTQPSVGPPPPLPGAGPLTPTYPAPDGTTSGQPAPAAPTATQTQQALQVVPQYTNEHGWGAANVGANSFTWVNPATGTGDTFQMQKNPDGTFNILRSDGVRVDNFTRDQFLEWFPSALADRYYASGGSGGLPGTGAGGLNPGTGTGAGYQTPVTGVGGQPGLNPQPQLPGGGSVQIGDQTISTPGIQAPQPPAVPDAAQYHAAQAGMGYDETVEGRVEGMLTKGNPLLEKAKSMTLQRANAKGLLNSSMANDAAMSAMMQNAIPIAQADAGNLLQMRLQNAGFQNQAAQFSADSINQLTKLGYTAQADLLKTAMGGNIEMQKLLAAGQIDGAMELIRTQSSMAVKELELQYADKTRASTSAAATMTTLQQGVTQILGSNLDANAKSAAINQLVSHARGSLAVYSSLSGNINLVEQFDSIINAPGSGDAGGAAGGTTDGTTGGTTGGTPGTDLGPMVGEMRNFNGQAFTWTGFGWQPVYSGGGGN